MLGDLLRPEIEELIAARNFSTLREALAGLPAEDIAEIFAELPADQVAVTFRILPRDLAAAVLEYLPLEQQEAVLKSLGQEQVAAVLNEMAPDDRTALLEEMPGAAAQKLIALLTPEERRIAVTLLGYREESIGRLMTPDYVTIRSEWTVGEVIEYLRRVAQGKETLNIVYVVDERGRLLDDVRLRDIVVAQAETKVSALMDGHYPVLRADDDQEVAIHEFKKYDRSVLPVVDSGGTLVGIVTVDDVLDVAEEEQTEDVQKMAAVEALDAPYMETGFFTMVRKRGVWLSALFLGEMLTASAMSHYEHALDTAVVLGLFIPLIISSGGNSGSQASTLVIRAMALREISVLDWWRVMRRELGCGAILGTWLAFLGLSRIHIWQWLHWADYTEHYHLVAFTVAISLVGIVVWGTLVGSLLPIILRIIKLDPATISAPFVATLVDVSGLVIYFTVAFIILRGTLL